MLTYGFDQSFLDYFGSNGVAAVEQAFQILNDLPPASSMSLNDYSTNLPHWNSSAEVQQWIDLKTTTLGLILEQLGLAQPTQSIFVLRKWDPILEIYTDNYRWPNAPVAIIPTYVLERNFDPELLIPSHSVNGSVYGGNVIWTPNFDYVDVAETRANPIDLDVTAIADQQLQFGRYFFDLSADDAGGLRYLLHTNNVNCESLLPDVRGATNPVYVNAAMRQGVNKITFVKQEFNSSSKEWISVTNQFVDTYLTNSQPMQQTLERIVSQPDFLFSVGDTGSGQNLTAYVARTGTTNWQNNGSAGAQGPGVIHPSINFIFDKIPPMVSTSDYLGFFFVDGVTSGRWSSFDGTTNSTVYPTQGFQETNRFTVRFQMYPDTFEWTPDVPTGGSVVLETSTNLTIWMKVTTVTNRGGIVEWHHRKSPSQSQRFFRVVPE